MVNVDHQIHADGVIDNASYSFGTNIATYFSCKSSQGQQQWVRKDTKQRRLEWQDYKKEKGEKEKKKEKEEANNDNING